MKKVIFIFLFIIICIIAVPKSFVTKSGVSNKIFSNTYNTVSSEVVGRIKISNSNIDYYITKHDDNNYYLNHNYLGEYDKDGSIFIDYRNNLDDRKLIIYGHNSLEGDSLLSDLEKYLDKDFYDNNKNIMITLNNIQYNYQVFAVNIVDTSNYKHTKINFSNDNEFYEHINYFIDNSIYHDSIDSTINNIITIQTCYYEVDNSYLLINARRI
jgi:sortase B